jgi:hypothetical protein
MRFHAILLAAFALAAPAWAETPGTPPAPPAVPGGDKPGDDKPAVNAVWSKTKVVVCEVIGVHNCRAGGCEPAAKLPSFRIDIAKHVMCALVSGSCRGEIRIGQLGFDRTGTRLAVHAIGVAFVIGIDSDGAMNGADVVKGRVVAIQGRCVPG